MIGRPRLVGRSVPLVAICDVDLPLFGVAPIAVELLERVILYRIPGVRAPDPTPL